MRLNNLPKGPTRPRKRVGKGEGNGLGKTSGRGQKGQKSRSGFSQRPGFESGHIPLYRRLPRRGFNNHNFRTTYAVVNLLDLQRVKEDSIDPEILAKAGLVRSTDSLVKVLGDGSIDRKITISAHKFSASAQKKIEEAGGKAVILESANGKIESSESEEGSDS